MIHRKGQIDTPDFTPIITDNKVYLLRYNFEVSKDENDNPLWNFDEVLLTKNEYDYHKSLIGIDDNFITNFIMSNEDGTRKTK